MLDMYVIRASVWNTQTLEKLMTVASLRKEEDGYILTYFQARYFMINHEELIIGFYTYPDFASFEESGVCYFIGGMHFWVSSENTIMHTIECDAPHGEYVWKW